MGNNPTYLTQELTTYQGDKYIRTHSSNTWNSWVRFATNSDLKRYIFERDANTPVDNKVREIFNQLPPDGQLCTCMTQNGSNFIALVQKHSSGVYGTALVFGYFDKLVQYTIQSGVWKKYTINMTETSML